MPKSRKSVVITDLDNTLFDWLEMWHAGFHPLLSAIVRETGLSEDVLIPDIKRIHEKQKTSEYAFLIDELPALRSMGQQQFREVTSRIRAEFERGRAASMRLYPTVLETLKFLKDRGCTLVGYTESMGFYSNYRLRKLELDDILDFVYSPPDHDLPTSTTVPLDLYTNHAERLKRTQLRNTPKGELKPNPKILLQIVADLGSIPSECLYIGDSLMKDVAMAQQASISDVWAKYGEAQHKSEYELLRKVTHWTPELVEKEKQLSIRDVVPSYILKEQFDELKDLFSFGLPNTPQH